MTTYLFIWNPKKFEWKNLEKHIEELSKGKSVSHRWSTGNRTKGLKNGDRFLLMKLGVEHKGIIACGTISNLRSEAHWDDEKYDTPKEQYYVDLNFEQLSINPIIDFQELNLRFSQDFANWTPSSNGIELPVNISIKIIQIMKSRAIQAHQGIKQNILFARIGYMEYYQGPSKNDVPIGGGSFNENNIGYEACNFLDVEGDVYGYYQPSMNSGEINLKRIDPKNQNLDQTENVLVIFFSKLPKDRFDKKIAEDDVIISSSVIVGWYKNATIYRKVQNIDRSEYGFEQNLYFIKAKKEDAYLLPVNKRHYKIGHGIKGEKIGNPGQSNSFYIYDKNKKLKDLNDLKNNWILKAIEYVNSYDDEIINSEIDIIEQDILTAHYKPAGSGIQNNTYVRIAVEQFAMDKAKKELTEYGYDVRTINQNGQKICTNSSFDMIAYKDGKKYFVEVKGTQSAGEKVIFTKNEVAHFENVNNKVILCVVHSIKLKDESIDINSGIVKIYDPWMIDSSKLTPISYFYSF